MVSPAYRRFSRSAPHSEIIYVKIGMPRAGAASTDGYGSSVPPRSARDRADACPCLGTACGHPRAFMIVNRLAPRQARRRSRPALHRSKCSPCVRVCYIGRMRAGSDRVQRLRTLRHKVAGHVWLAACGACGHLGALPTALLIRRFGELEPVESAMLGLRCDECGATGRVTPSLTRFCHQGCGFMRA